MQMNGSIIGTLALGFVLGLKHALDADHVVAVSTIVGRHRSMWKSSLVGAMWGLGHTASLFAAAVAVIALRVTISPTVALGMEFCVGLMLMILGADLLRRVVRGELSMHSHQHGEDAHIHSHVHASSLPAGAEGHHAVGSRPFFIGLVHGLAGSAALMLVVLSTISNPWIGLVYVLIFGGGTIGGMLVMSALIGLPFALASRLLSDVIGQIQFTVGLGSFAFGVFYTWQVAIGDGLATALLR